MTHVEVLHSLLNLVTKIQMESSVGMCPGPALMGQLASETGTGLLSQSEVIDLVTELAELELVEFPTAKYRPTPTNGMFLVRVTAAGRRALSMGPAASFWHKRAVARGTPLTVCDGLRGVVTGPPDAPSRLGKEPTVQLHQMLTVDQVFMALKAGVELAEAEEPEKERARQLLRQGQDICAETSSGPSLAQWASHNLPRLIRTLEALAESGR